MASDDPLAAGLSAAAEMEPLDPEEIELRAAIMRFRREVLDNYRKDDWSTVVLCLAARAAARRPEEFDSEEGRQRLIADYGDRELPKRIRDGANVDEPKAGA